MSTISSNANHFLIASKKIKDKNNILKFVLSTITSQVILKRNLWGGGGLSFLVLTILKIFCFVVLFLHYTIRSLYCHRISSAELLGLGLSTLVHQGHNLLDPSADLNPSNKWRTPSHHIETIRFQDFLFLITCW